MQEQQGVEEIIAACLATWPQLVDKAAAAGYTFCLVGYFELAENEHHLLYPMLQPLLSDIESKGRQALWFKPHLTSVYDHGGSIVGYVQGEWMPPTPARKSRKKPVHPIRILSNHYIHTRDVTSDAPPPAAADARGAAYSQSELPTLRTSQPGYRMFAAAAACWHEPRLR